jgi:hypothetical protein
MSNLNLYKVFSVYEGFGASEYPTSDYYVAHSAIDQIQVASVDICNNIAKIKDLKRINAEKVDLARDALKFDMEYMMAQQKNTSMIGMMTVATLTIATICLIGRYS